MPGWFSYIPYLMRAAQREAEIKNLASRLFDLEPAFKEGSTIVAQAKALINEIAPGTLPVENYDVEWIQSTLNKVAGETLAVDGDYGEATRATVKRYQASRGLVADGWVGLRTMSVLFQEEKKT